ncbi:WD repeat-containing protein 6 [Mactra antiquata]
MTFTRICHSGPVTELYSDRDYILAGIGSQLHVYCVSSKKELQVIDVLSARVIHGIIPSEYSITPVRTFCIYGQKCIRMIQYDDINKKVDLIGSVVEFDDWVWNVSFIEDEVICLALGHNVIVTYDLKNQCLISSVHCQEKCILYCAKFICSRSDCVILAAGTVFNQVLLWSSQSNTDEYNRVIPFHRLTGHQGVIFSIDYDERSDMICSVSDDRSIRLYQLKFVTTLRYVKDWENIESILLHVLYGHSARVWDVTLLTNTFVSVGEDSTCCVWSYSGKVIQKFKGHKGKSIWSMCVDKEEKNIVTGGGDNSIRIWSLNDVNNKLPCVTSLDLKLDDDDFPRNTQLFDIDKVIVVTNKGKVLLYDINSEDCNVIMYDDIFSSYTVMDVCIHTNTIAIGNVHGTLRILCLKDFNMKNGTSIITADIDVCTGKILSILWLNSNTLLTTAPDGIVDLWCVNINKDNIEMSKLYTMELNRSKHRWVTAATLCNNGGYIICGDRTGSLFVYKLIEDKAIGDLIQTLPKLHGKGGVTYIGCHGDYIYTTGRDGVYRLFDLDDNSNLHLLQNKKVLKGLDWIEKLNIIDNDNIQVIGFHSDTFIIWSIEENQKLLEIECGGGHRAWDIIYTDTLACFVYVKTREVKMVRTKLKSNQSIIKKCLHGRELCDGKFISNSKDKNGNKIVAMVTCSEDTSICLSFLYYGNCLPYLDICDTLTGHISSVRCLYVCSSSYNTRHSDTSDRKLIFSGGGRSQLKVWRIVANFSNQLDKPCNSCVDVPQVHSGDRIGSDPTVCENNCDNIAQKVTNCEISPLSQSQIVENNTSDSMCNFNYECLGGLQLSSLTRKHWKPWRQPINNSDPETRIVDISVITPEDRNQPESTLFMIATACSDGIFRVLTFCEASKKIELIASLTYHDHSILKTSHFIIPTCKNIDNQSLDDSCHGECSDKSGPIKILVMSAATDGKVAFWDMTDLSSMSTEPVFTVDVHQSGINSLYFGEYTDDRYVLVTGGDDNAVNINILMINIVDNIINISICYNGGHLSAHSAQITGVHYIPHNKIVTVSIDQRICLWCIEQENQSKISVRQLDSMFTNVSDVSNIDTLNDESGKLCILVTGNGVEVLELHHDNGASIGS